MTRAAEQRGGAKGEWLTENKRREKEFGHRLPLPSPLQPRTPRSSEIPAESPACRKPESPMAVWNSWRAPSTLLVSNGRVGGPHNGRGGALVME